MLSIERCRKLIGEDAKDLSDERIAEIRDALYEMGELALECYFKDKQEGALPKLGKNEQHF